MSKKRAREQDEDPKEENKTEDKEPVTPQKSKRPRTKEPTPQKIRHLVGKAKDKPAVLGKIAKKKQAKIVKKTKTQQETKSTTTSSSSNSSASISAGVVVADPAVPVTKSNRTSAMIKELEGRLEQTENQIAVLMKDRENRLRWMQPPQ